jgi:hypothetical protein
VVTEKRRLGENLVEWKVVQNSLAVLAAGREKLGIKEEKRKWRGLVGAVVTVVGERLRPLSCW